MKRTLTLILAAIFIAASFASCASVTPKSAIGANVRLTSSDGEDAAAWLTERLGERLTDRVVLGTSADGYGIDLSSLEDDGYVVRALGNESVIFARTTNGLDRAVRAYAKAVENGGAAGLDVTYHDGARIKKLTIAGVDISEFVICCPGSNADTVSAANELSRLIEIATGVKLSVFDNVDAEHVIFFGEAPRSKALGDYGYEYEVKDGLLYIRGSGSNGATSGVRRFLENELGWGGLSFGEAVLPAADEIDVAEGTKRSEKPAFDYLNMYRMAWGSYDNPVHPSNAYGKIANCCHGMQSNRWADLDVAYNQICYTDEDNYYAAHENIRDYINARITAGAVVGENFFAIDIAQGDNNNYCSCKECRKVFAEEGCNTGAVLRFANALAEEINEVDFEFAAPLWFQIFAYAGTNAPPKVTKPNEYISVTYCTDGNCSNHVLDGSECVSETGLGYKRNNKIYAEWLEGWCAICDKMYVWDYALDTALGQYTVTDTIYSDFRYLASLGVIGIFWQCQFDGLGIQRVEHQLLWALDWNIDMTEEQFEKELCKILRREYGDGWKYIREYLDVWNAEQNTVDCWNCWGWTEHMFATDKRFLETSCADHFDEAYSLFESAIAAADSRAEELRLKALSCHMIYEGCYSDYKLALEANDEARQAELSRRYDVMISRLKECGFDVHSIMTVDGARNDYEETLFDEFANYWAGPKGMAHGTDPWYKDYFRQYGGK